MGIGIRRVRLRSGEMELFLRERDRGREIEIRWLGEERLIMYNAMSRDCWRLIFFFCRIEFEVKWSVGREKKFWTF